MSGGLCVLGDNRPVWVGLLCAQHRGRISADLAEISTLWCELNLTIGGALPRVHVERTRHSRISASPAPIDLTAAALRDPRTNGQRTPARYDQGGRLYAEGDDSEPLPAVPAIVASWLQLIAEERPLTETRHRLAVRVTRNRWTIITVPYTAPMTLPAGVVAQLSLLGRHGDWCAGQPWVDDLLRELGEMRRALAGAVRDHPYRLLGACRLPDETDGMPCGGPLLEEAGTAVVHCGRCHARWSTPQEQARLALALEEA